MFAVWGMRVCFVCTEGASCGGGEKSAGSPPALTKAA